MSLLRHDGCCVVVVLLLAMLVALVALTVVIMVVAVDATPFMAVDVHTRSLHRPERHWLCLSFVLQLIGWLID